MATNPATVYERGEFERITTYDAPLAQCGLDPERAAATLPYPDITREMIEQMIDDIYGVAQLGDPYARCLIEFAGSLISYEQRSNPSLQADDRKETIGDETVADSLAAFYKRREETASSRDTSAIPEDQVDAFFAVTEDELEDELAA